MTLAAQKAEARRAARAARALAHTAGQGQAAEILADWLVRHRGRVLAGYMPIRSEIDPASAMVAHDGPVCLPVIVAPGEPLRFREWAPGCPMVEGPFGARVPLEGAWLEPEVLIVPLLAFDRRGYRLGYGGGFYDRTLERLRARHPVTALGFAFAAQEVPLVPTEPTDQPLDAILTETGPVRLAR